MTAAITPFRAAGTRLTPDEASLCASALVHAAARDWFIGDARIQALDLARRLEAAS